MRHQTCGKEEALKQVVAHGGRPLVARDARLIPEFG
jgi:hypothetical protein